MMRLIEKSSKSCDGLFVDTLSLNIKEHDNFNEFNQGMCEDQTIKRYSRDDDQKFPFIARLVAKYQQDEIFCGGSLITKKLVLTAAHCVVGLSSDEIEVYVGSGKKPTDLIRRSNFKIIIHPKYNYRKNANDIALIKFDNGVTLSSKVNLLCLPFDDASVPLNLILNEFISMSLDDTETKETLIQGNANYDCSSKYLNNPHHARTNVIEIDDYDDPDDCEIEQKFRNSYYKPIDPLSQFCAGNKTLKKGNSGMPAYAKNESERLNVYGLVSYGAKISHSDTLPTIFTKIHSYIHWILCNASN